MVLKPQKGAKAPAAPVLLYARAAPASPAVQLDGKPLTHDMALLSLGAHTLVGADWLWVTQVGLSGQPMAEIEVSLTASFAPELGGAADPGAPPPRTLACARIVDISSSEQGADGVTSRTVHYGGSRTFQVSSGDEGAVAEAFLDVIAARIRDCQRRNGTLSVKAWRQA